MLGYGGDEDEVKIHRASLGVGLLHRAAMNERILAKILARPDHGLSDAEIASLGRMVTYLDRSSLRIVWDDGAPGRALVLHLSDDAVRYRLTVAELIALWEGLRAGRAIDWSQLPAVAGRGPQTQTGDPQGSPV